MALTICKECSKEISDKANNCIHCGNPIIKPKSYGEYVELVKTSGELGLKGNILKTIGWFLFTNAAVVLSLTLISGGALLGVTPYIIVLGSIFPMISLLLSKWLCKRAHRMIILREGSFKNETEESLYRLVEGLSSRAGIKKMPEVGIYQSSDMNAFATGLSRNSSLVAFSTAILEQMDEKGLAAVAAHEVAHIANGDMIILSIVQSVINAIVLLVTIPFLAVKLLALFSDEIGYFGYMIITFIKFVVTTICLFLGNLVVKAFSRKREYQADKLAARLIDKDSMIHALSQLERDTVTYPKEQMAYAAFKINSPVSFADIFSTHPSIVKRIKRLQEMK